MPPSGRLRPAACQVRRCQIGQIHKVAPKCLDNYASEMPYREETRRWSNGDIFRHILGKCARVLTSRDWCGHWRDSHWLGRKPGGRKALRDAPGDAVLNGATAGETFNDATCVVR